MTRGLLVGCLLCLLVNSVTAQGLPLYDSPGTSGGSYRSGFATFPNTTIGGTRFSSPTNTAVGQPDWVQAVGAGLQLANQIANQFSRPPYQQNPFRQYVQPDGFRPYRPTTFQSQPYRQQGFQTNTTYQPQRVWTQPAQSRVIPRATSSATTEIPRRQMTAQERLDEIDRRVSRISRQSRPPVNPAALKERLEDRLSRLRPQSNTRTHESPGDDLVDVFASRLAGLERRPAPPRTSADQRLAERLDKVNWERTALRRRALEDRIRDKLRSQPAKPAAESRRRRIASRLAATTRRAEQARAQRLDEALDRVQRDGLLGARLQHRLSELPGPATASAAGGGQHEAILTGKLAALKNRPARVRRADDGRHGPPLGPRAAASEAGSPAPRALAGGQLDPEFIPQSTAAKGPPAGWQDAFGPAERLPDKDGLYDDGIPSQDTMVANDPNPTSDSDRFRRESLQAWETQARASRQEYLEQLRDEARAAEQRRQQAARQATLAEEQHQRVLIASRRLAAQQTSAWRHALHDAIRRGDKLTVAELYREALWRQIDKGGKDAAFWRSEAKREAWAEFLAQRTLDASKAGLMALGGPTSTAVALGGIGAAEGASTGYHGGESGAQIAARAGAGFIGGVKDAALSQLGRSGASLRRRAAAGFLGDGSEAAVQARLNGQSTAQAVRTGLTSGATSVASELAGEKIDAINSEWGRTGAQTALGATAGGVQAAANGGSFVEGAKDGFWGSVAGQAGGAAAARAWRYANDQQGRGGADQTVSPTDPDSNYVLHGQVSRDNADPLVTAGQDGGTYRGEGYAVGAHRNDEAVMISAALGANGRGEVYGPDGRRVLEVLPDGTVVDGRGNRVDPLSVTRDRDGRVTGYTVAATRLRNGQRVNPERAGDRIVLAGADGPVRVTKDETGKVVSAPADLLTARGRPSTLSDDVRQDWDRLGAGVFERYVDPVTGEQGVRAPIYGQDGRQIGTIDDQGRLVNANGSPIDPNSIEMESGRVTRFATEDGTSFTTSSGRAEEVPLERFGVKDRGGNLAHDDYLAGMRAGDPIPSNHLHETGASAAQIQAMGEVARQGYTTVDANGNRVQRPVRIGSRTTNIETLAKVRDGRATPKPMPIKSKTIKFEDTILTNGLKVENIGEVGFIASENILSRPQIEAKINSSGLPAHQQAELLRRTLKQRDSRLKEAKTKSAAMAKLKADGIAEVRADGVVVTGPNYKAPPGTKPVPPGTPFAGDIDSVYVVDAETGRPLTYDQYQEVVGNLKSSATQTQHGAEVYSGDDVARSGPLGIPADHPQYQHRRMIEFDNLSFLEGNQRNNSETMWEVGPDGVPRRGQRIESLSPEQVIGGPRFVPSQPAPAQSAAQSRPSGASPFYSGRLRSADLSRIAREIAPREDERQP